MAWTTQQVYELYAMEYGVYPDPFEFDDYLYPYEITIEEIRELKPGCYQKRRLPAA